MRTQFKPYGVKWILSRGFIFIPLSFPPYTSDYWDPNQTTSDFMGPNQFNPPLDSHQEQWAYNQNFDSDTPLPNQISEWTTQSSDPWTLESTSSPPPPSNEQLDRIEQMMRIMEEEHKSLQELRGQVEMMCHLLSFTPIISSSETVNQYDSNMVTPITFPYFSSEDHNPYDPPNQFHKDYNFNMVDLDTSLLEEDTFNVYHSNNCQIESQHIHLEIEIAKQDYEPHLVRSATMYHDLYIVSSYDNPVDHSHIDQTYTGPMLRNFESKLPLNEEIHSTPTCSHEHDDLRKHGELVDVKIDDILPLTQKQDQIMDQLIKQLPFSHLDNNFKFDMRWSYNSFFWHSSSIPIVSMKTQFLIQTILMTHILIFHGYINLIKRTWFP